MTGEGGDYIIIDDPLSAKLAESQLERAKALNWWKSTMSTRANDPKKISRIVIMQRLHEKDLTGHFLAEYEDTVHLKIPNQAPERIVYSYPRTGRIRVYDKDAILQPSREDAKELARAKRDLGSYNYAAQRQQEPVPRGGGIIKEHWFKYYDVAPERFDLITLSLDCAFKDLDSSDFVVLQAWGQKGSHHYLIKQLRSKLSFLNTRKAVKLWAELFPTYHECLIEAKANGDAIINSLQGIVRTLIPISPKESKHARLVACEPDIEAGDVFLPNPEFNPWVKNEFVPEVTAFPKAEHDDQVDAMTQYLNRSKSRSVGSFGDEPDEFDNLAGGTFAGSL